MRKGGRENAMARGKQSIVIAEDYTILTLDGLASLRGGMLEEIRKEKDNA